MKSFFNWFRQQIKSTTEDDNIVKYLIIGLGNIGDEYEHTRHNIGFDVVDALAKTHGSSWKPGQYGFVAEFRHKGRSIHLLKPNTYMNLSGKAVRYWVQKLKIQPQNWLVVVDEIQFDVGVVKMHKKGSSGSHNGLKSIQDLMQTSQYARIRLGIGNDFFQGQQVEYVLGTWPDNDWKQMQAAIDTAVKMVHSYVSIGIDRAMSAHNMKKPKA